MQEQYQLRRCLGPQGLHQVLGNQDNLMRSGLLEQDISGAEERTWMWWNAATQITPARGITYRGCWDMWILQNLTSTLTNKQLMAQCSNIRKWELLSQLEIDEVQWTSYGKGKPGQQVRGGMSSSPPHLEVGYQAPASPYNRDSINTRATDLRLKIMKKAGHQAPLQPTTKARW